MEQTISILGANGFIGRALTKFFLSKGHQVLGGVRTAPTEEAVGLSWVEQKFIKPEDFGKLLQNTSTLIHCASSSNVPSSSSHPVHEFDSDLRSSLALIEALQARNDIHVIFLSSGGTIYGQKASPRPITEDTTPLPISYHGASKLAVESFLNAWAAQNEAPLTIVRPSNVFGPGQRYTRGFGVIPTLFKAVYDGSKFRVRGSLRSIRDYLYIDDLVELIYQLQKPKGRTDPIIVNAGSGIGTSLGALIKEVERACNHKFKLETENAYLGEVNRVILDIASAKGKFGWIPRTGLPTGLDKTWEWWQEKILTEERPIDF